MHFLQAALTLQVFSMVGQGKVDWASQPITITISFSGTNFEDILFEISNIPESKVALIIFYDLMYASK